MNLLTMLWLVTVCLCFSDLQIWWYYFSVLGSCGWGQPLPHWTVSILLPTESYSQWLSTSFLWLPFDLITVSCGLSRSLIPLELCIRIAQTLRDSKPGLNPHVLCWAFSIRYHEPFLVSPSHRAGGISYQWQDSQRMTFVLGFISMLLCHLLIL